MVSSMIDSRTTFDLGRRDFCRIADVIRQEAGIDLPDSKLPLVQSRLLRRIRILNLKSYAAYCDLIENGENRTERMNMVSALTTNVTSFFRERHHFDYLHEHVMPKVARRLKTGKAIRIWSAGCSSGEEPYSLAMTFLADIPGLAHHDFKILATDIDPIILNCAIEGVYPKHAFSGLPVELYGRYVESDGNASEKLRINKPVRELIAFRQLNLIDDWPMKRSFDIIMCRNVVIYFGEDTKAGVWTRLAAKLRPGGVLFTGHSERLSGPAAQELKLVATTTYRVDPGRSVTERTSICH